MEGRPVAAGEAPIIYEFKRQADRAEPLCGSRPAVAEALYLA